MIYSDRKFNFDQLINKDATVSIYYQNIQKLGIKIFLMIETLK